jgi:hypothetical protein
MASPTAAGHSCDVLREFQKFVYDSSQQGLDCAGNVVEYIPISLQRDFWVPHKIRELLSCEHIILDFRNIRDSYVQVLSILAAISSRQESRLDYLRDITQHGRDDPTLPWDEAPRGIFVGSDGERAFTDFREAQWKFCPVRLVPLDPLQRYQRMWDRKLDRRCIFPISRDEERIGGDRPAKEANVELMKVNMVHEHLDIPTNSVSASKPLCNLASLTTLGNDWLITLQAPAGARKGCVQDLHRE